MNSNTNRLGLSLIISATIMALSIFSLRETSSNNLPSLQEIRNQFIQQYEDANIQVVSCRYSSNGRALYLWINWNGKVGQATYVIDEFGVFKRKTVRTTVRAIDEIF